MFFQFQENAQWSEGFLATNVKNVQQKRITNINQLNMSIGAPHDIHTLAIPHQILPCAMCLAKSRLNKNAPHMILLCMLRMPQKANILTCFRQDVQTMQTPTSAAAQKRTQDQKRFNGIVFSTRAHTTGFLQFCLEPKAHQRYEMTRTCND